MTDDIDFKKLLDQEPEFAGFAKDALYEGMLAINTEVIKGIWSFYQIGMTSQQVAQWMKTNMQINKPPEGVS